jgi:histidinol-phosphatase
MLSQVYDSCMPYQSELAVARAAAREAGALALHYQGKVDPEIKSDNSPVTKADKESEHLISSLLSVQFADDGLLGEEGAARESKSGRRWIIDPIDGTRDFVRGNPLWGVLIGLEDHGEVVVGVAHFPGLGRMYSAAIGEGAWRDGERIQASSKSRFDESVLMVNGCSFIEGSQMGERIASTLVHDFTKFWAVRSLGGSIDACMVASGEAEVWLEPKVAPWDLAAHKIILEEAGAKFLTLDGGSAIDAGHAIGCSAGVEGAVRKWLNIP